MEYYSALKKKDVLTHATTWRELEDIMLSETNQSQMKFHLNEILRVVGYIGYKVQQWLPGAGWKGRLGSHCLTAQFCFIR